jgi:formylglycine-generating enzyme required for sulfatase activity
MSGNVWEWVKDWYHDSYNGAPTDGKAREDAGSSRVLRGGSFGNADAGDLRADYRDFGDPGLRSGDVGFRVARSR